MTTVTSIICVFISVVRSNRAKVNLCTHSSALFTNDPSKEGNAKTELHGVPQCNQHSPLRRQPAAPRFGAYSVFYGKRIDAFTVLHVKGRNSHT